MVSPYEQEAWEEQVARADAEYMLEDGSAYSPYIWDDLQARIELSSEYHATVLNEDLWAVAPGDKVQVNIGEFDPDATGIESLQQEILVKTVADAGDLFEKGGPTKDWTADMDENDLSPYVDGMFLAERSKQTGEKLF